MRTRRNLDLSQIPVQPVPCRTCPFEGEHPLNLGNDYGESVNAIVTGQSQHFCHSSRSTIGGKDTKLCRGGRNLLLRTLAAQGVIDEPTDAAFESTRKELLGF